MDRFFIWGTGRDAERYWGLFQQMYLEGIEVAGFIDSDQRKCAEPFMEKQVISPDQISSLDYDYITIWSADYEDEIRRQAVHRHGVPEQKITDIFAPYKQKLKQRYAGQDSAEILDALEKITDRQGLDAYAFEPERTEKVQHEVFYDADAQLSYIYFENKKMYLRRSWNNFLEIQGRKYVGDFYAEQDPRSPHRYEAGEAAVQEGDILVDAGVCEGNFSLHHIDKVKKVYLIECNEEWMEALQHTFAPYKEKVVFCNKFLSDTDTEKNIRLDTLVKEPADFIKMDIEGEEIRALEGGRELLSQSRPMRCAICSYHRRLDEEKIRKILEENGFSVSASAGYMLYIYDPDVLKNPELRRGIVRGVK